MITRALKLLLQARQRGCFDLPGNRKLLETHRDFEPFRKRADFAKLQADIAADTGRLVLEKKAELRPTDPPDREINLLDRHDFGRTRKQTGPSAKAARQTLRLH